MSVEKSNIHCKNKSFLHDNVQYEQVSVLFTFGDFFGTAKKIRKFHFMKHEKSIPSVLPISELFCLFSVGGYSKSIKISLKINSSATHFFPCLIHPVIPGLYYWQV